MSTLRLYFYAYLTNFMFYFVWLFVLANLLRLLIFGFMCLDDCYAYDPNPFTLWKAAFWAFFPALVAGLYGISNVYDTLHPPQKKFNRGDEGTSTSKESKETTDQVNESRLSKEQLNMSETERMDAYIVEQAQNRRKNNQPEEDA